MLLPGFHSPLSLLCVVAPAACAVLLGVRRRVSDARRRWCSHRSHVRAARLWDVPSPRRRPRELCAARQCCVAWCRGSSRLGRPGENNRVKHVEYYYVGWGKKKRQPVGRVSRVLPPHCRLFCFPFPARGFVASIDDGETSEASSQRPTKRAGTLLRPPDAEALQVVSLPDDRHRHGSSTPQQYTHSGAGATTVAIARHQ